MIKVLELFAGYGSQALALKRLGLEFESRISEIDKYAIQAYNLIHGETFNYGDICQIDEKKLPYFDLITYSSPCQDFSIAGKQRGGEKDSGTRSSLLWECERIIRAVKPKYLLMENVKNLVGKKFKPCFCAWLKTLESLGYSNFWQVLNAKDYGIPQNRERVFVVSIRKDVDIKGYEFPLPIKLEKRLKDMLEDVVDEKYYLSDEKVGKLVKSLEKDVSNTIRCGGGGSLDGKHTWDLVIGSTQKNAYRGSTESVCSCLTEVMGMGGGQIPMVTRMIEPLIAASRGINPDNPSDRTAGVPTEQRMEINSSGVSNTLPPVQKDNWLCVPINTCVDGTCQALTAHLHKETANDCTKFERHSPATGVLIIKANTKKGYDVAEEGDSINLEQPNSTTRRGRIGKGKAQTLTTSCNQGVLEIGNIFDTDSFGGNPERGRVYDDKGISPCLSTMQGGGLEPKILEEGIGHNPISKKFEFDGFHDQPAPTLLATDYKAPKCYSDGIRVRKLTPRECWRLMGVDDADFDKVQGKISNTQLYKLAGNSIVVDVLADIFRNIFINKEEKGQLTLL